MKEKQRIQELEDAKNKKELELFEKKFGPKKFKERKQRNFEEEPQKFNYKLIGISIFCLAIAVVAYVILSN